MNRFRGTPPLIHPCRRQPRTLGPGPFGPARGRKVQDGAFVVGADMDGSEAANLGNGSWGFHAEPAEAQSTRSKRTLLWSFRARTSLFFRGALCVIHRTAGRSSACRTARGVARPAHAAAPRGAGIDQI